MRTNHNVEATPRVPLWVRRPGALNLGAHGVAGLVFAGQLVVVVATGSSPAALVAVIAAGAAITLSLWKPWAGLVLASAASFVVTAGGGEPISVWMIAVLLLFSFTLQGRPPVIGTIIVAAFFFGGLTMGDGYGGGALVAAAALFTAIGGAASGAALRLSREHWLLSEARAREVAAAREAEVERRVAEERLRIARDLHDVVGHQVAMLSVNLGVAEMGLPAQASSSREALDSARVNARTVVAETQRILVLLRRGGTAADDEALRPTPSLAAIAGLVSSFENIGLEVDATITVPDDAGDPVVGVTVYRVVQEALTNAYRHGQGAATVDVREAEGRILVTVDNIIGLTPRGSVGGTGLGLIGMRERVESCGGQLTVDGANGRFRVCAEFSPVGAQLA